MAERLHPPLRLNHSAMGSPQGVLRMHARGKSQRGFSLIELMIVVAIIVIIAGWTVMGGTAFAKNMKANAAMGTVVTQLRQARQLAISARRNVLVTFTAPNQIQLTLQTLPGEAPAAAIPPVFLNDNAKGGLQFAAFPALPDTPMNFGNTNALNFTPANGGAAGLNLLFTVQGSFVGTTGAANFSAVGNSNLVNGSIFVGDPTDSTTARAITILGATGRVRSFYWDGQKWDE